MNIFTCDVQTLNFCSVRRKYFWKVSGFIITWPHCMANVYELRPRCSHHHLQQTDLCDDKSLFTKRWQAVCYE